MSITVCMLIKNEEKVLDECLGNIKEYFSNIIVVDNGSTDASADIASNYDCRVISAPDANFDAGRNIYLENVTDEWIFVLDADERITAEGAEEIKRITQCAGNNLMGFYLPRFEYTGCGKWSTTMHLRLYRSHPGIRHPHDQAMHSSPTDSIKALGGEIQSVYAPIHHLDILYKNRTVQKRDKYLNYLLKDISTGNYGASTLYFLGLEYSIVGKYKEAEDYYIKAFEHNPNDFLSKLFLSQQLLHLSSLDKAKEEAVLVMNNGKFRVPALIILAEISMLQGNVAQSITCIEEALIISPNDPNLHINLSALLEKQNPEESIKYLEKALKYNPYLMNPIIYQEGNTPNLFQYQISFLSCTKTFHEHMFNCLSRLGGNSITREWSDKMHAFSKSL